MLRVSKPKYLVDPLQLFFFNVGPPKEDIFFWTPSKSFRTQIFLDMSALSLAVVPLEWRHQQIVNKVENFV